MANFEIPDNPNFSTAMRQLESTDPATAELFNALFLQLLENDAALLTDLANYFKNTGGYVNGDVRSRATDASMRTMGVENSLRNIVFRLYEDGTFRIYDNTKGKNIIYSDLNTEPAFYGTASGITVQAKSTGTDVNSLIANGIYFFGGYASNYTNAPNKDAHNGLMFVSTTGTYIYQRWYSFNQEISYERRNMDNGAEGSWSAWKVALSSNNVSDYALSHSGGELSGDLKLVSSDTTKKTFQLKNSLRTINFIIYTDGTFRIEDATNGKKLLESSVTGNTSIEATASNVPASGVTAGTFAGNVVAPASTAYTTAHIRNAVLTTTDPGEGASVSYPDGTLIFVYE